MEPRHQCHQELCAEGSTKTRPLPLTGLSLSSPKKGTMRPQSDSASPVNGQRPNDLVEPATPHKSRQVLSPLPSNKFCAVKINSSPTAPTTTSMSSPPYLAQFDDTSVGGQPAAEITLDRAAPLQGSRGGGTTSSQQHAVELASPVCSRPTSATGRHSHRRTRSRIAAPIGEVEGLSSVACSLATMTPPTPIGSPRCEPNTTTNNQASAPSPCIASGNQGIFSANSPAIREGLGIWTPPTPPSAQLDSLQNIFVALAHKERTVLEAQQALDDALEDLKLFREKLNESLGPVHIPFILPVRPRIIARHSILNLGIHTLYLVPDQASEQDVASMLDLWAIDHDSDLNHKSSSSSSSSPGSADRSDPPPSIGRRIVFGLLDAVHCIITTALPTVQSKAPTSKSYGLRPDYPSPAQTLLHGFNSN